MALNTVSSDRLSTNVKNTNFTAAEKQDLTDDILPLAKQFGQSKNLIINGAMQVAQRGTSSTDLYYQTIDRFRTSYGNIGSVALTQSQQQLTSSDTPYSSGFRYFYRAALAGAGDVNTNGFIGISQRLEAQDVAQSGWNYTSASSNITLQFWFRCSTNQTFYGVLETSDGTAQSYPFAFTASGNNTWTKITKTIPGNSNLQFDTDTPANAADRGLKIGFTPWYGTDYTGSKTADAWSAYVGAAEYPDYSSAWLTAGASTFDFTGVQLEVGSVATDFEHRSFGHEISLCERYFQRIPRNPSDGYGGICNGRANNGTTSELLITFPEMRATPSIASSGNLRILHGAGAKSVTGVTLLHGAKTTAFFSATVASGLTAGQANQITMNNDATAHITLTAEL